MRLVDIPLLAGLVGAAYAAGYLTLWRFRRAVIRLLQQIIDELRNR